MRRSQIKNIIEAILFSYAKPISIEELNMAINEELSPKEIEIMLHKLIDEYKENDRGIQIIRIEDKYQMCSNEEYAPYIKKLVEPGKKRSLSQATLETLIIIAYKQPITRIEIDAIRGVNSSGALAKLQAFDLIREDGKKEVLGRPNLYVTTDYFLDYMGINHLEELPVIDELEIQAQESQLFGERIEEDENQ